MAVGTGVFGKPPATAAKAAEKQEDIPPAELWSKLSSTKRPTHEVPFPRKDPATGEPIGTILMRPLTQGEIIAAQAEALIFAKSMVKEHPDLAARIEQTPLYENACACEILSRACWRVDKPELPVFPTGKSVRDPKYGLTHDECGVLMNDYEFVQIQLGPIAAYLTEEMREALIKRLKEGASALPLASLSLGQLSDLVMHLVAHHPMSQMDNGSPGEQPENPSLNTSD